MSVLLAQARVRAACFAPLALAMLLSAAGCSKPDAAAGAAAPSSVTATAAAVSSGKPTQVAARVNAEELTVHQLNERMAAWSGGAGVSGPDDPLVGRGLNRLVELTLIRQEAEAQGLAKKPEVMRQLQAAHTEALARAWAQQVGEEESAPSPPEVRRYFDEHPEAFSKRRLFVVQELRATGSAQEHAKDTERVPDVRQAADWARSLESKGYRTALGSLQFASEQLTPAQRAALQALTPGQAMRVDDPQGLRIWWLQASLEQPIGWDRAQGLIERLLTAQTRAERVRRELERLRAQSRIEFVGDFARWGTPADSSAAGPRESAQTADSTQGTR